MKKVIFYLSSLLLVLTFHSCEKDEEAQTNSTNSNNTFLNPITADYLPDTDSSYWVYQVTVSDSTGNNTTFMFYDTMWVSTSSINGKPYKFYKFDYYSYSHPNRYDSWYMRDSLGVFINEENKVVLDINAINSIVRKDTLAQCYYYQYKMLRQVQPVVVPLGTFTDVVNYQTKYHFSPCNTPNGYPLHRILDRMFARNVGLVYESYGLTGDFALKIYERKLVAYQIRQ